MLATVQLYVDMCVSPKLEVLLNPMIKFTLNNDLSQTINKAFFFYTDAKKFPPRLAFLNTILSECTSFARRRAS